MAPARCRTSGNAAASIGSDTPSSTAPAEPCTARSPLSASMLRASAQPADANMNTTRPPRYNRRRPSRSPTVAAVNSNPAIGRA
ncbi:Uncharacterised protein [Mycobacteroides abscessus subsp. abscessus]|nr:Uncharacterised protein [Mycobacteroides abscessus subsp. abscessus]